MAALEFFCAPSSLDGPENSYSGPKRPRLGTLVPNPESALSQVLLVDDTPVQLQVRETILRNAGFGVAIATSAESALALLRTASQHVGLVITDHVMPGTSGSEFVRRLRASDTEMPVIVLSGMPDAEQEYQGLNVAFRLKPLPPEELIELVRTWIRGQTAA